MGKESFVSFSLALSNVPLASLFRIRFYWEKKDILLNFSEKYSLSRTSR